MLATVHEGLWDTPRPGMRPPARPAVWPPGSDRRPAGGNYRTALVVGLELEDGARDTAAQHLGAAAWTGHEGETARFLWPSMFASVADEYDRRFGIDDTHLHAIAAVNLANAKPGTP